MNKVEKFVEYFIEGNLEDEVLKKNVGNEMNIINVNVGKDGENDMKETVSDKESINIQRHQLRHSSDPLTIPENTFKRLFRISIELAHWVFHQIVPYMRESKRTTAIPKNLRVSVI
ncbi:hypothetical protein FQA39_LY09551 [Lamprigera yunnana]|nr:hypothetical protein FQA39_LY09551 [Lamprigera yunnana]